jgi:lipoprotein-anchoring transpeptidase ErfK/SrfK
MSMRLVRTYSLIAATALAGVVSAPPAAGAAEVAAARAGEVRLVVDVSERKLRVVEGGEVKRVYRVAVGKPAHPTPQGRYGIRRVVWNPRWVPPDARWARRRKARGPGHPQNPMGRVKLFFSEPDYYIHGTNNRRSLGKAASHGCIRMANSDAIDLARLVMKYGGAQRESDWYRRVLGRKTNTQQVHLSRAVRLEIRK